MSVPDDVLDQRLDIALTACKEHIRWYQKHSGRKRIGYWSSVITIALLGFAGTIIGAFEDVPAFWRIAPPALTALIVSLAGYFRWQSEWIRFSMTLQALRSELFKYQTAAIDEYGDDIAPNQRIANFANRVDAIVKHESAEWKAILDRAAAKSSRAE